MRTTELPSTPLLTADEEIDLARRIEAGVYADHLLSQGLPHWASEEELETVKQDGEAAWNRFYMANLKMVMAIAWRWARLFGVDADDVAQECCLALGGAIRAWDHKRGTRFSTLAWPRLTVAAQKVCQQLRDGGTMAPRRGQPPSLTGKLTPSAPSTTTAHWCQPTSLTDDVVATPTQDIDASDIIWSRLRWLPPQERRIIEDRYGFRTGAPRSYTVIAKELNTTPYFVKRMETSALATLEASSMQMAA